MNDHENLGLSEERGADAAQPVARSAGGRPIEYLRYKLDHVGSDDGFDFVGANR